MRVFFILLPQINAANAIFTTVLTTTAGVGMYFFMRRVNRKDAATLRQETASALALAQAAKEEKERIAEGHEKLVARVSAIEDESNEFALLKHDMQPLIEATKRKLVDMLIQPHPEAAIPDAILKKVKRACEPLTDKEWKELTPILDGIANSTSPHVTEVDKLVAQALPPFIKMAELQAQEPHADEVHELMLVSVPADHHPKEEDEDEQKESKP